MFECLKEKIAYLAHKQSNPKTLELKVDDEKLTEFVQKAIHGKDEGVQQ